MEVLDTAEMARADRLTIAAGTPGFALMLSAGQAVAEAAIDLVEEGPIVVVAGGGNNGGDGFVAAAELAARGREVSVILLCDRDSLQGDAASAARGWKFPVLPFNPQAIGRPALIIDALFGAGLNRPVKGDPLDMIEAINANGAPVLSVDLPSGVTGTTGAVMVHVIDTVVEFGALLTDKRLNTCVIGPGAGVGERTRDFVLTALSARRRLVLDADALTSFAGAPDELFQSIKASQDQQVVLTPHEGEFPRLFSDISNKHPYRSKLERVRAAAERSGAIVLLKGPDTVVASADGRATIASNAPPWLATAGAGDVLAGMISGLLAQGVPAFEAASIGAWMHGEAAREAGPGLIAEDLPEVLPAVFRRLYDEFGIDY